MQGYSNEHKKIMFYSLLCGFISLVINLLLLELSGILVLVTSIIVNLIIYYKGEVGGLLKFNILLLMVIITFLFVDMFVLNNWLPLLAILVFMFAAAFGNTLYIQYGMLVNLFIWGIYYYNLRVYTMVLLEIVVWLLVARNIVKNRRVGEVY